MKCEIKIDKSRDEEILIYAHELTPKIQKIISLAEEDAREILGYKNDDIVRLSPKEIECITISGERTVAITKDGEYRLKERLYFYEAMLGDEFIKINKSTLVKVDKIKKFSTSLGGSLLITLCSGYKDYVSRRQIRTVKERFGI